MKLITKPDPYGHKLTSTRDTALRYHESIVLWDGEPVLASYSEDNTFIMYGQKALPSGRWSDQNIKIDLRDEKFSNRSILGWFNSPQHQDKAVYISRLPTRRARQGLTPSSVTCFAPVPLYRFSPSLFNIAVCMKGNFTPLDKIPTKYPEETGSWALSHKVALATGKNSDKQANQFLLYFEDVIVGSYDFKERRVNMKNHGFYSVVETELSNIGLI